ncbi:MAG: RND transporter, partial [Methylococcaceae bacterium]|nr:RND transporter [Methylococcaceae bacterium]
AGFGNLIDAETSRRQSLASDRAVAELEQEQAAAWIALYRAAGGAWQDADSSRADAAQPLTSTPTPNPSRDGES